MNFYNSLPKFKYFSWIEIVDNQISRQGIKPNEIPTELYQNIIPTIRVLDELREYYNNAIIITSTYRTKEYNKKIGGKENSLHTYFNAVDFTVKNKNDLNKIYLTLDSFDKTINKFNFLPKPSGNFGIGLYSTFIHLDTRSILNFNSPIRWRG